MEEIMEQEKSQDENNLALVDQQTFSRFVKSNLCAFLAQYNLAKIIIDVGNGYKGSVKVNKNGEYEVEVTFKELT